MVYYFLEHIFSFEERVDSELQRILYKSDQDHLINVPDFHAYEERHLKNL